MQFISCIFRTKTPLQQRVTIATGVVRRGNSAETWYNKRAIVAVVAKNNTVGNCAVVRAPFPLVTSRQAAVITHTSCLSLPETCWPPQLARKMPSVAEKPEVCRGVFNHGHLLVSARRDCSGLSGGGWEVGDALTTMRRVNRRRVGVVCVCGPKHTSILGHGRGNHKTVHNFVQPASRFGGIGRSPSGGGRDDCTYTGSFHAGGTVTYTQRHTHWSLHAGVGTACQEAPGQERLVSERLADMNIVYPPVVTIGHGGKGLIRRRKAITHTHAHTHRSMFHKQTSCGITCSGVVKVRALTSASEGSRNRGGKV